jgi:hypothetical protein
MKTDTLGRRLRTRRQPDKTLTPEVRPRDDAWINFLLRHGNLLTIDYLHAFTKADFVNLTKSNDRQAKLFNELKLLNRPAQQFDPNGCFLFRRLIHSASPLAVDRTKALGTFSEYWPSPKGSFPHQLLVSAVSASFELSCMGTAWAFTPQHEVLERAGRGMTIDIDGDDLIPDLVIKLTRDGRSILLFVEIDRGTEPNWSDSKRQSHGSKIQKYKKLIGGKLYKDLFKVDCGAFLLIITSSATTQTAITDEVIPRIYETPCSYILTHYIKGFGTNFFVPDPIDIFNIQWKLSGHPPFTFKR